MLAVLECYERFIWIGRLCNRHDKYICLRWWTARCCFTQNRPYRSAHWVHLPRNEHRSIENCYPYWEMSVIITYLNDNAQTPLGRFVVDILYDQVCNKYTDNSNGWSLGLKQLYSVDRPAQSAINSSPSSTTLLISINGVSWRFFLVHSCACKNGSCEPNHPPFHGWFVIPMARIDIIFLCTKFDSSSFSHSWDMDATPKI